MKKELKNARKDIRIMEIYSCIMIGGVKVYDSVNRVEKWCGGKN